MVIYVPLIFFPPNGYISFIITIFKYLFLNIYLLIFVCMDVFSTSVCELCAFLAPEEALELELQAVINHHVDAEK